MFERINAVSRSADLFGLVETNPTKAAAFFQPDTLQASREMKLMVWRILLGCEIQGIELTSTEQGKQSLFRFVCYPLRNRKRITQPKTLPTSACYGMSVLPEPETISCYKGIML